MYVVSSLFYKRNSYPLIVYLFAVAAKSLFEVQSRENSAFYCYSAQYYLYKMLVFFFYCLYTHCTCTVANMVQAVNNQNG
jgi:hypothetical protein